MSYERDPIVEELPYYHYEIQDPLARAVLETTGDFLLRWRPQTAPRGQYVVTVLFADALFDNYIVNEDPARSPFTFQHRKFSARTIPELIAKYVQEQVPVSVSVVYGPVLIRAREWQPWETLMGSPINLHPDDQLAIGRYGPIVEGEFFLPDYSQRFVVAKTFWSAQGVEEGKAAIKHRIEQMEILRWIGNHPNILEPIGVGLAIDLQEPLIVYDRLRDAQTLEAVVREQKLPDPVKIRLLIEALSAIAHVHKQGWLVRDIRAQNFLLETTDGVMGQVKMIKLGSAKYIGTAKTLKDTSHLPDQVKWMAPESLESGIWSVQSDIWSVGVLIWQVFANDESYKPWKAVDSPTLKEQLIASMKLGQQLPIPTAIPTKTLVDLVIRCWSREPSSRPQLEAIVIALRESVQPAPLMS